MQHPSRIWAEYSSSNASAATDSNKAEATPLANDSTKAEATPLTDVWTTSMFHNETDEFRGNDTIDFFEKDFEPAPSASGAARPNPTPLAALILSAVREIMRFPQSSERRTASWGPGDRSRYLATPINVPDLRSGRSRVRMKTILPNGQNMERKSPAKPAKKQVKVKKVNQEKSEGESSVPSRTTCSVPSTQSQSRPTLGTFSRREEMVDREIRKVQWKTYLHHIENQLGLTAEKLDQSVAAVLEWLEGNFDEDGRETKGEAGKEEEEEAKEGEYP